MIKASLSRPLNSPCINLTAKTAKLQTLFIYLSIGKNMGAQGEMNQVNRGRTISIIINEERKQSS